MNSHAPLQRNAGYMRRASLPELRTSPNALSSPMPRIGSVPALAASVQHSHSQDEGAQGLPNTENSSSTNTGLETGLGTPLSNRRAWRATRAAAASTDALQAVISVVATLPRGGMTANLANYAAGPALALSALPAEFADALDDEDRWRAANRAQRGMTPFRNISAAANHLLTAVRAPVPNANSGRLRTAWSLLREEDEFADGMSSLGNLATFISGIVTLVATLSSGDKPAYINTAGSLLSIPAALSDLWDAIRSDPSRSRRRWVFLWASVALNGASAALGVASAQLSNDRNKTASDVTGLLSSITGLFGSVCSELADLIDRPGFELTRYDRLYVNGLYRLLAAYAEMFGGRSNALEEMARNPEREQNPPVQAAGIRGRLFSLRRHAAALLAAWDEAVNAPLAPSVDAYAGRS